MAGPFTEDPTKHLIPADKHLDPSWVKSLFERGDPEVFSGEELKFIGMPVGGICAGQIYLGGDGRLWHWDIFKSQYHREPDHGQRLEAMTICGHYTTPITPETSVTRDNGAVVEQGFVLHVSQGDTTQVRYLDQRDFDAKHIEFRGEYPVGRVTFREPKFPVTAQLEAFSPFIPLSAAESDCPATILSWTLTNQSEDVVEIELAGFLENAVCPYDRDKRLGFRRSRGVREADRAMLLHSVEQSVQQATEPAGGDQAAAEQSLPPLSARHGFGSLALGLLDSTDAAWINPHVGDAEDLSAKSILAHSDARAADIEFDRRPVGSVGTRLSLQPGETQSVRFVLGWYFPDYNLKDFGGMLKLVDFDKVRRHYAKRFRSAADVVRNVALRWNELAETTRLWNKTWYDSTLPHWLLDRTFIGIDCLATQTCHWFDNDRFFGWEGVDCCEGTCTHVWQYAQAMARIFPELERGMRAGVDYGIGYDENGLIGHRGEIHRTLACDGQCGTIIRVLREHQMSADKRFLTILWPKVKKSFQYLERLDTDGDGLLDADQPHTLDAAWSGPIAWVSSLYLAAAQACVEMAEEVGDSKFAEHCRSILEQGRRALVTDLFNGEYFIHKPDPSKPKMLNTNDGCHIDQVLGQSFGWQVGLAERIVPKQETVSALNSLWKYNFTLDAGGYALQHRAIGRAFRWFAMEGEGGLVMCTWPRGGAEKAIPGMPERTKENPAVWTGPGGYFNECMNGFEYQAAAHMIYEGEPGSQLVEQGLAITRAIHDRYAAHNRNPYNEIECSDHYARSMAGYGVFLAVCGFEHHGPEGRMGFAPRVSPEDFRAPFTCAEGWGTFSQQQDDLAQHANIDLQWGQLQLRHLALTVPESRNIAGCEAKVGDDVQAVLFKQEKDRVEVTFAEPLLLSAGAALRVQLTWQ